MAQVIGKVTKLEGVAYAIDPATGEARTLLKGDPVYIGEVIKTAPGTVIAVEMRDGSLLTLGETSALQLSEDLLRPADTEEAIAEADVLKRALAEGQLDINDINTQQPTAAGGSASSALDGDISIFELSSAEGEVHAGFDTFVEQETPDFQEQEDGLFTPTQPINRPPEVINPLRGLQSSDDGEQISLDASQFFGDPDGDTLTYSASGLPAGLSIDPATGVISGTIDRSASQSGPYTVTVTATDP
ncbi:putative Ig domain-containing protein, partial [Sulfurivirga sp.]|uniref:putative Ig domain-containing protein n=1 Tax=Sulfurivirga sp. TaxID=2614236 RepID=UPI0025E2A1D8